jgi:hypothetical protein
VYIHYGDRDSRALILATVQFIDVSINTSKNNKTHHFPDVKANIQSEVDKRNSYSNLELFYEDIDEACLEDVRVEEKEEYHYHSK